MIKLVIFGERPGPNTDPERPLHPHTTTGAAARLAELLGMTEEEYLRDTIRYNVADDDSYPTTNTQLRQRVVQRMRDCYYTQCSSNNETRFLFLGRAAAMGGPPKIRKALFGAPVHLPYGWSMVIPHTSGRNRFYNSAEDTERMSASARALRNARLPHPLAPASEHFELAAD